MFVCSNRVRIYKNGQLQGSTLRFPFKVCMKAVFDSVRTSASVTHCCAATDAVQAKSGFRTNRIADQANASDFGFHDVARFQKLLRLAREADAGRRTRGNDVARFQRQAA